MAGIYIHIPFCKSKCLYCDFFSSVDLFLIPDFIFAVNREMEIMHAYLDDEQVETIYFGGGTPSLLSPDDLSALLNRVKSLFPVSENSEITVEVNPDDLSLTYALRLLESGFNRISIGVQSLSDRILGTLGRRHDAASAIAAIHNAVSAGFKNISVDLIYGIPGLANEQWIDTLKQLLSLPVQHLSAYHLTIEKNTPLHRLVFSGRFKPVHEKISEQHYLSLIEICGNCGFRQYEVSNFAYPGFVSRHNTNYWKHKKYLGIGPGAHSFNLYARRWNSKNILGYLNGVQNNQIPFESEILTPTDHFNEYILTGLRTTDGINMDEIRKLFGEYFYQHCINIAKELIQPDISTFDGRVFRLLARGLFLSDSVIVQFMQSNDSSVKTDGFSRTDA